MATKRPSLVEIFVCQTIVLLAAVDRRAFGDHGGTAGRRPKKIRLAFDGRGAAAFRHIGDRGRAAEIVGERHDGAAMKGAKAVV